MTKFSTVSVQIKFIKSVLFPTFNYELTFLSILQIRSITSIICNNYFKDFERNEIVFYLFFLFPFFYFPNYSDEKPKKFQVLLQFQKFKNLRCKFCRFSISFYVTVLFICFSNHWIWPQLYMSLSCKWNISVRHA